MMIYIVIEYIIDYFILIQTPFQVFESTTVCVIRKYKFKEVACSDVLFRAFDITTSSREVAVGLESNRRQLCTDKNGKVIFFLGTFPLNIRSCYPTWR